MLEEEIYFNFGASLRVVGASRFQPEIEDVTGISPTKSFLKGESILLNSDRKAEKDIWILSSPLPKENPLTDHLNWLWNEIELHVPYFKSIQCKGVKMDVFCTYSSNCDHAGFRLLPGAALISEELNIPLEFSVIVV